MKTPGITVRPLIQMTGAHSFNEVFFDNVRVPAANLIGGREGAGFKTAMKVLDKARLNIAAVCVGAAMRMLDDLETGGLLPERQVAQQQVEFLALQRAARFLGRRGGDDFVTLLLQDHLVGKKHRGFVIDHQDAVLAGAGGHRRTTVTSNLNTIKSSVSILLKHRIVLRTLRRVDTYLMS